MRLLLVLILSLSSVLSFAEDAAPLSAAQLIAGAKAGKPSGSILIRARLEQQLNGTRVNVLNVQIKRRALPGGNSEQLYQVTFSSNPEHKGESLLLRSTSGGFTGAVFVPGKGVRKLTAADRRMSVFGTDMTLDDILADFLNWTKHDIVGHEKVDGNMCAIIDSAGPGSAKVKSWVEEKRYIPWRIQMFDGGDKPVRVAETQKVMRGGTGYWFPRELTISTPAKNTVTKMEGTSSDQDKTFTDADFTEEAMQSLAKSAAK